MDKGKDVIAARQVREVQLLESVRNNANSKFIESLPETDKELYRNVRRAIIEETINKDYENGFIGKGTD